MSRLTRLGTVAGLVALLSSGGAPALADPPLLVEEPWRETVRCGSVTGVASGTVVQRVHLREGADGTVRFVLTERVVDSTFVNAPGAQDPVRLAAGSQKPRPRWSVRPPPRNELRAPAPCRATTSGGD